MARRSGDAEGRIARGAGGIWDGFDGNTAFEWLRAETRERPCVASKDETSTRRITIYGTTYWFGLFCHTYREKNNIARRFVRRIRTSSRRVRAAVRRPAVHEPVFRAITRDPCHHGHRDGARPSFTRTRTSRPASVPCRTSGFFLGFSPRRVSSHPCGSAGADARGETRPRRLRAAGFARGGAFSVVTARSQPPILSRDRRFRPPRARSPPSSSSHRHSHPLTPRPTRRVGKRRVDRTRIGTPPPFGSFFVFTR